MVLTCNRCKRRETWPASMPPEAHRTVLVMFEAKHRHRIRACWDRLRATTRPSEVRGG